MSNLIFDADTLPQDALEKYTQAMQGFDLKGKTDAEYYRAQAQAAYEAGWVEGEFPTTARKVQALGREVNALYKVVMGLDPKA